MLNRFARSAVTGLLALFGLNEANPFPRVRLSKVRGLHALNYRRAWRSVVRSLSFSRASS